MYVIYAFLRENWHIFVPATIIFYYVLGWIKRKQLNLPPGPMGLPIVGYIPFLSYYAHEDIYEMSKKYGKII